jgi:hypothetical protein
VNRGPVIGTYLDTTVTPSAHSINGNGVYRLSVTMGSTVQQTQCISYTATAEELALILMNVSIIQQRGGVTVRRYGNGQDPTFGFGYTYRIEMDAPSTSSFASGPVTIALKCQSTVSNCKCGQTVVNLTDSTGARRVCPASGRIATFNSQGCAIPPNITVTRIDSLGYTQLSGVGTIVIDGGYHRLPPVVTKNVTLETRSGTSVVSADVITWQHLRATNIGRFIFAGKGWVGWKNAVDLFADPTMDERGMLSYLNSAPPFAMTLKTFYLDELGAVFTVCPGSTLNWHQGTWAGGMIGGRATLSITNSLVATGTGKALRYAMTMIVNSGATFTWLAGNISLANGANITVYGTLAINSLNGEQFIGEAQLLGGATSAARALLMQEPQLQWHGYFDDTLPDELRGGWYQNPLCAGKCLNTNQLNLIKAALLTVAPSAEVTFSVPLNLFGNSTLAVGAQAQTNLASGGFCDVSASMSMGNHSTIQLSGGNMIMGSHCKITGSGELLVTAGMHDMGFQIDAHITISGGYMIWPLSRSAGGTVTFNGGLTIDNTGVLQVQPFSTSVSILNNRSVILKDQGIIQFPDIGTASEPSLFDESDAPDAFPSGVFRVEGIMYFEGGTLTGKATYNIKTALYLTGGTKYLSALSILQSYGHCEWSSGDLIASTGANFKSFGTLQMSDGPDTFDANSLNEDPELSALSFHSWDLGEGSLNYNEYTQLRSIFVSKVPNNWTSSEQLAAMNAVY